MFSVLNVKHCLSLFFPLKNKLTILAPQTRAHTHTHTHTKPQGFRVRTDNILSTGLKKYSQYFQLLSLFQPFVKYSFIPLYYYPFLLRFFLWQPTQSLQLRDIFLQSSNAFSALQLNL